MPLEVDAVLSVDPHPEFPAVVTAAFELCPVVVDCPEKFQAEDALFSLVEECCTPPVFDAFLPHLLTPSGKAVVFEAVTFEDRLFPGEGPPRRLS